MAKSIKAVIFDWAGITVDSGCFAPVQGLAEASQGVGITIGHDRAWQPMDLASLDHVRNTVARLREQGIKIGVTSDDKAAVMERLLPRARAWGFSPDFLISSDQVSQGRPSPCIIWEKLMHFGIQNPREAVEVGNTTAAIIEGKNAGCWTVGVLMGFTEPGLTRAEVAALSGSEFQESRAAIRARFYRAGADYIIDDMDELVGVVADINRKLRQSAVHKLLTPGPLTTRHAVKQAMLTDHCTWDDEYKAITRSVLDDLTGLAANDDYATVLLPGSGTYAVEAMINCLTSWDEKILFLVNGAYGRRMLTIAANAGKQYEQLAFDATRPVDPEALERKLSEDPGIGTVVFVHCETTTGVINPLEELTRLAKAHGKKVLVDAMSSFAAYEIDMPGLDIDALASSANKCIEGLPGLAFVIAKRTLLEECRGRSLSHSLDLHDQYRGLYAGGGKFRFTSPTNILLALRQALDEYEKEGGLAARRQRYRENQQIIVWGLEELGIRPIVAAPHRSYIITTFALGDLDFAELYAALKAGGFIIYPGKLTALPTFRLGHIGDVYPDDMQALVDLLTEYLRMRRNRAETP
ncbi:MAG: 2-aminoethylphosphonate--pyruvate transaminase [Bacillota bacterium]|nr:2-aminoethylphosphonate--pyruvate transaminase [Bacillota bacterium]